METINVNRPQPAAGTAVCLTTCQFLVISKDDHHSVETSIRRRDIEQKMRFFSQHPESFPNHLEFVRSRLTNPDGGAPM